MSLNDDDKKLRLISIRKNTQVFKKLIKITQADFAFVLDSRQNETGRTEHVEYDLKVSSLTVITKKLNIGIRNFFSNVDFN